MEDESNNPFIGPYRVAPGRLSVSRTFGDLEAKHSDLGGMSGIVVCTPDVEVLRNISNTVDYVVIGSDGIFDKIRNSEINEIVWSVIEEHQSNP